MSEILQGEKPERRESEPRRFPVFFLIVAVAIGGALTFYFWSRGERPRTSAKVQAHLPFGPAEQAYAGKIQVENVALSRSENFLHQQVTALSGEIVNNGERSLRDVQLTITFSDELHQVVLRDSRVLFGAGAVPLAPSARREFEISFEHIPSSWNHEPPAVSVSGLQF
jgi:hypothetical protein